MPVQELQCPNCGAPIDFAGGTRATCSFCQSSLTLTGEGVKAASALNDLLENQPVALGVDADRIRQLVSEGKKIDAIKLYRRQTGAGLKEAKDAIDAMEATGLPSLPNPPGQPLAGATYRPLRPRNSTLGCLFGCLPILLFIGLCAAFITLSSQVMFRVWGPLDQVLKIINSDPSVARVFGQPITPGPFVTGKISGGDTSSSAHFSVPIYGPKQNGELDVSGSWRKGLWDLSIWVTYENSDGEEQSIKLIQKVK